MPDLFLNDMPHTEEGKQLSLTAEQEMYCRVVYKQNDDNGGYAFHELWDPDKEYSDEYIILPLRSVYVRCDETFPAKTEFANVIGSSGDDTTVDGRKYSNWKALLKEKLKITLNCCANEDTIFDSDTGMRVDGFKCSCNSRNSREENIVGAHVIKGREARTPDAGENLYIVPLCWAHNTYKSLGGTGIGYFMKNRDTTKVITLTGFVPKKKVTDTLIHKYAETAFRGIDVSQFQGNVDYNKVKASGISYVMIRAGFGKDISQKDPLFELNYLNAKKAGLNVGAYWYSYAVSIEDAEREAKVFIEAIRGKQFEFPVYLDLEENRQFQKGSTFCNELVDRFCGTLQNNGYFTGLYASRSPLQNYFPSDIGTKYSLWVAEYGSRCNYSGKYDMWQYSSNGSVDGIIGNVDLDICYRDFPSIMKQYHLNGF